MRFRKNEGLAFYKKEKRITSELIRSVLLFLFWIVMAIALAYFLVYFFGIRVKVLGNSMAPSLANGEEVLIDKVSYSFAGPKEGDIIIFYPNGNENSRYYIKRVVGIPGDKILISNGILYRNKEAVMDYFSEAVAEAGIASTEITLDEEEYFVMGDNVNNSEDSRSANIGVINKNAIEGKIWFHMAKEDEGIGFVK